MSEEQQPMEIVPTTSAQHIPFENLPQICTIEQSRNALEQLRTAINPEIIVATNPITNQQIQFQASGVQRIRGSESQNSNRGRDGFDDFYCSHHPVCILRNQDDEEFPDDEEWYYCFLDRFTGPQMARYDRGHDQHWQEFLERIQGFTLMSFEQWRDITTRIEGRGAADGCTVYTEEEVESFETFVQAHLRRLERNQQYETELFNS